MPFGPRKMYQIVPGQEIYVGSNLQRCKITQHTDTYIRCHVTEAHNLRDPRETVDTNVPNSGG